MKVNILSFPILVAPKDLKCYQQGCMNKIKAGQFYFALTGIKPYPLNTCVKCIDKWYQEAFTEIEGKKLDLKNEQGKFQLLAEEYYGIKKRALLLHQVERIIIGMPKFEENKLKLKK